MDRAADWRKIRLVASGDRAWGHRPIWRYLLLGVGILFAGYVAWLVWNSGGKVGDPCEENARCRSRVCLVESGRLIRYCTDRCETDEECPAGWKCLASPDLSNRQVCVRP